MMRANYSAILNLTNKEPEWWDDHGTPRYCKFLPSRSPNIYNKEVVFLLIRCQECRKKYRVSFSGDFQSKLIKFQRQKISSPIHPLHYGDPPRACDPKCIAGSSMNSELLAILKYWIFDWKDRDWIRRTKYEGQIVDEDNID